MTKSKEGYVEVLIAVRKRDGDYNIVGKSAQKSCEIKLKDFDALALEVLEETPLPVGQRYTSVKKRVLVADKIKRMVVRLFSGAIDG